MSLTRVEGPPGTGSLMMNTVSQSVDMSPIKTTAEKLQMLRRDVKPGNGTSLLSYQNTACMRKGLLNATFAVEARISDNYFEQKQLASERYNTKRNTEMDELKKENNRLFGRLLNIYEVSWISMRYCWQDFNVGLFLLLRKNTLPSLITNLDPFP